MGMFFELLNSINSPNHQGSVDQLSQLAGSVQQLTGQHGLDASATQSVLSALGGALQPALQQQATSMGGGQLESLIGQFTGGGAGNAIGGALSQVAGGNANMGALSSLMGPQMQQQLVQTISQKTGLNAGMLQGMVPMLLPVVMNFFKMGSGTPGSTGGNPILNSFLNGNQPGGADLGEVMKFANRFLNAPHQP